MGMSVVDEAANEQRFQRIYTTYQRHVLAYCLRRIDPDQAIECAAETFLVAWRRIADVPDGTGTLAWLYRTAHHVIGDRYRRRARGRARRAAAVGSPNARCRHGSVRRLGRFLPDGSGGACEEGS